MGLESETSICSFKENLFNNWRFKKSFAIYKRWGAIEWSSQRSSLQHHDAKSVSLRRVSSKRPSSLIFNAWISISKKSRGTSMITTVTRVSFRLHAPRSYNESFHDMAENFINEYAQILVAKLIFSAWNVFTLETKKNQLNVHNRRQLVTLIIIFKAYDG